MVERLSTVDSMHDLEEEVSLHALIACHFEFS